MAHPAKWTAASPDEPVADVARRSLQDRLAVVEQFLPLAAENWRESMEYVHGLRVSARRAEAALDMYRDLVPDWRGGKRGVN